MNRTYELMSTLGSAVTASGGTVKNTERLGKRRLAYTVRKFHDGVYLLLTFEGGGGLIHELERRLRVTEPVIKFLTVRIDEEQKRLDKIKAIRDAKRKAVPAPAAVAEPTGDAPAATA
jgi:small subunit ribosomal protein S6